MENTQSKDSLYPRTERAIQRAEQSLEIMNKMTDQITRLIAMKSNTSIGLELMTTAQLVNSSIRVDVLKNPKRDNIHVETYTSEDGMLEIQPSAGVMKITKIRENKKVYEIELLDPGDLKNPSKIDQSIVLTGVRYGEQGETKKVELHQLFKSNAQGSDEYKNLLISLLEDVKHAFAQQSPQ